MAYLHDLSQDAERDLLRSFSANGEANRTVDSLDLILAKSLGHQFLTSVSLSRSTPQST